jgi:tripartite-type tricarboxylate transporter receptor subunit TctC
MSSLTRRGLIAATASLPMGAQAQGGWSPDRPIRMLVGFAAGGSTDQTARVVAAALSDRLGQPVVVENRPGAAGNIAAEATARATPDGYTLFLTSGGTLTANRALFRSLPFDTLRDFAPISLVAFVPNVIVVNPSVPARTLAELIAHAKANPGKLNFGSAGPGTSLHLAAALFCARAGIEMAHIPYRGGAPAAIDLVAGKIEMIASPVGEVIGQIRGGALRPLAVTTLKRATILPDVPTVAETLPGFEVALWNGVVAPAGTPGPVQARLAQALADALAAEDVRAKLIAQGSEPTPMAPDAFGEFIRAEIPRWAEIIRISGASAD